MPLGGRGAEEGAVCKRLVVESAKYGQEPRGRPRRRKRVRSQAFRVYAKADELRACSAASASRSFRRPRGC